MGMGETHVFILLCKMASVMKLAVLAILLQAKKLFFGNVPLNAVLKAVTGRLEGISINGFSITVLGVPDRL